MPPLEDASESPFAGPTDSSTSPSDGPRQASAGGGGDSSSGAASTRRTLFLLAMTWELLPPADRPPALALPLFAALATPPAVRTFMVFIAIV